MKMIMKLVTTLTNDYAVEQNFKKIRICYLIYVVIITSKIMYIYSKGWKGTWKMTTADLIRRRDCISVIFIQ